MENIILILCQAIFSLPFLMEKAEIIMNFYLDIFGWHPLWIQFGKHMYNCLACLYKVDHMGYLSHIHQYLKTDVENIYVSVICFLMF